MFVLKMMVFGFVLGLAVPARAEFFPWWAFDSVIEEVQDRGTLRVGLGLFPPGTACNAAGELVGFEIDVATKMAADMGVDIEFVPTNWHYIIPSLIAEEFDAIIGMTPLPHRNLKVNFTVPYNVSNIYLVAHTENTADLATLADFNDAAVTIATRRGASSIPAIRAVFPQAMLRLFDGDTEVLQAVVAGAVHAVAAYETAWAIWVEAHPETLHRPFAEPFSSGVLSWAVRKGDLDALNFFNTWMTANTANGWLKQRRQYWFESRAGEAEVTTTPALVAACEEAFQ